MSKAILVIDKMPKCCMDCKLFKNYYNDEFEEYHYACAFTEELLDSDDSEIERHKDCPLKPIPKSMETNIELVLNDGRSVQLGRTIYFSRYDDGYNACLKEIFGEEQ